MRRELKTPADSASSPTAEARRMLKLLRPAQDSLLFEVQLTKSIFPGGTPRDEILDYVKAELGRIQAASYLAQSDSAAFWVSASVASRWALELDDSYRDAIIDCVSLGQNRKAARKAFEALNTIKVHASRLAGICARRIEVLGALQDKATMSFLDLLEIHTHKSTHTDIDGHFAFKKVEPGSYLLYAGLELGPQEFYWYLPVEVSEDVHIDLMNASSLDASPSSLGIQLLLGHMSASAP